MTDRTAFLAEAEALLGPRGFTREDDRMAPWLTDWRGRYTGAALAIASPADTAELAALMKLCAAHKVAVVPQGGNSSMSGGATPDAGGDSLLLSLRRMTGINVDVAARRVTCGAGVVLQNLHESAAAQGLRFPLTLGGKGSATVGGLVSTNAGGSQVLRHGNMRAQVLGLEAVLADGTVFSNLTPLKKDNRGFDLKQLLIGSEGTLGIVTAACLRLLPAIAERVVVWCGLASIQAARALLLHAEAALGEALEGFEVIPEGSLEAVLAYLPDAKNPLDRTYPWQALIEVVADSPATAETLHERVATMLAAAFEGALLADAVIATSEAQAETLWALRESVAPAERAKGAAMQHDISVPVENMPDFIAAACAEMEASWPGTRAVAFGHLGDGNVHFHVVAPKGVDRAAWEAGDGKAISAHVHDLVTQWGGSISAEHGIGQLKVAELARLADAGHLAILRAVKQALDPSNLLNPGKLVPLAHEQAKA